MIKVTATKTREVLLTRAAVTSAVGALLSILAVFGVHTDSHLRETVVDDLALGLPVVLPMLSALWSRLHVTPVWDPRAEDGTPLVPAAAPPVPYDGAAPQPADGLQPDVQEVPLAEAEEDAPGSGSPVDLADGSVDEDAPGSGSPLAA